MRKSIKGFPSMSSNTFYTLNTMQKQAVLGGDSGGGSVQDGLSRVVTIDGKQYTSTPMRCWTNDVMKDGVLCYEGEVSTIVLTPYRPKG